MERRNGMDKFNRHVVFKELRRKIESLKEWQAQDEYQITALCYAELDGMIQGLFFCGCINDTVFHRLCELARNLYYK